MVTRDVAIVAKCQDRTPYIGLIEQLPPHRLVIRARLAAGLGISVGPHETMWVGQAILDGERDEAGWTAVGNIFAPAARKIG